MDKTYVLVPRKCIGCRTCELACSFVHSNDGKLGRSRIHVHPIAEGHFIQMNCLQCVEAACVKVCPTKALARSEDTGAVRLLEGRCIGCALCATACPFGHIHFDRPAGLPVKCDLCGGEPACAKFCPSKALEMR
ncbi:MAG: 4Fe-4S dicluster domain-containing protein [Deltaproteobacteria bacterium]|nr:4Fe-4S dicluster domain-containing protein [Deltaproteobacteria bacterium]